MIPDINEIKLFRAPCWTCRVQPKLEWRQKSEELLIQCPVCANMEVRYLPACAPRFRVYQRMHGIHRSWNRRHTCLPHFIRRYTS